MAKSMTPEMFKAALSAAGGLTEEGKDAGGIPNLQNIASMFTNPGNGAASGVEGLSERQLGMALKLMGIFGRVMSWYESLKMLTQQKYFRLGAFSLAVLAIAYYYQ